MAEPFDFEGEQKRAQTLFSRPRTPQRRVGGRSLQNVVSNILRGSRAGIEAAQSAINRGDFATAAILGAAGSLDAPRQEDVDRVRRMREIEAQQAEFEAQPIDAVDPSLVSKAAELGVDIRGVPINAVSSMTRPLQQLLSIQQTRQNLELGNELNDAEKKLFKSITGQEAGNISRRLAITAINALTGSRRGLSLGSDPRFKQFFGAGEAEDAPAEEGPGLTERFVATSPTIQGTAEAATITDVPLSGARAVRAGSQFAGRLLQSISQTTGRTPITRQRRQELINLGVDAEEIDAKSVVID